MSNEIEILKKGVITLKDAENKHLDILQNIHNIKKQYLLLGKELYEMKESKGYLLLSSYDSWQNYIQCSEIGLELRTVQKIIQIYKIFILKWKLLVSDIEKYEWTKLSEIAPVVKIAKDKQQVRDLLKMLEVNSLREIRKLLKKAQKTSSPSLSNWEQFEGKMFPENYTQEVFRETVRQFIISVKICIKRLKKIYDLWGRRTKKEVERLDKLRGEKDGMGELVILMNEMNEELGRIMNGKKSITVLKEKNNE